MSTDDPTGRRIDPARQSSLFIPVISLEPSSRSLHSRRSASASASASPPPAGRQQAPPPPLLLPSIAALGLTPPPPLPPSPAVPALLTHGAPQGSSGAGTRGQGDPELEMAKLEMSRIMGRLSPAQTISFLRFCEDVMQSYAHVIPR